MDYVQHYNNVFILSSWVAIYFYDRLIALQDRVPKWNWCDNVAGDDAIYKVAIYADDTTHFSECNQVCNLWQRLELASELGSDLPGIEDWGRKWLVDFNAGKTQLGFDQSNNSRGIDEKMSGSILERKSTSKIMGLSLSSKLDWGLTLSLWLKLPPKKRSIEFSC